MKASHDRMAEIVDREAERAKDREKWRAEYALKEADRILREKDLDAIEPLMRTHLYGGVSRMGSKIYSDEYRGYFKLPENKK